MHIYTHFDCNHYCAIPSLLFYCTSDNKPADSYHSSLMPRRCALVVMLSLASSKSSPSNQLKDQMMCCMKLELLVMCSQVSTLLEIWRHIRIENNNNTTSTALSARRALASLPEPPHARERLIKEIKFFITHLRSRPDYSRESSMKSHAHIVEYVESSADFRGVGAGGLVANGNSSSGSSSRKNSAAALRPPSAISSRDGKETPLRPGSSDLAEGRYAYRVAFFMRENHGTHMEC